jgi:hypothetical protein
MYGRRRLTKLEAALYGGIAAVLIVVLAYWLLEVMELAERSAMEATVYQVNAAVSTRLAFEVMRGGATNLQGWARRNPFKLANMSPPNFAGEVDSVGPGTQERGTWAFDASRAELVYLPRLRTGLQTSDPEGAVRFKASVSSTGMGYTLVPASPYRWE